MTEIKLWLWRNGLIEFWAFDNPYPCYPNGDPMTLGEPYGYALFKESVNGRPDVTEEYVMRQMEVAKQR
jgi:hypothetical protein